MYQCMYVEKACAKKEELQEVQASRDCLFQCQTPGSITNQRHQALCREVLFPLTVGMENPSDVGLPWLCYSHRPAEKCCRFTEYILGLAKTYKMGLS